MNRNSAICLITLSIVFLALSGCSATAVRRVNKLGTKQENTRIQGPTFVVQDGDDITLRYNCIESSGPGTETPRQCSERLSLADPRKYDRKYTSWTLLSKVYFDESILPGMTLPIEKLPDLSLAPIPEPGSACRVFTAPQKPRTGDYIRYWGADGNIMIRCRLSPEMYCDRRSQSESDAFLNERGWWAIPTSILLAPSAAVYDMLSYPFDLTFNNELGNHAGIVLFPIAIPLGVIKAFREMFDPDQVSPTRDRNYGWECSNVSRE